MESLIVILIAVAGGFALGSAWATRLAQRTIYMMLKEFGITDEQVRDLANRKGINLPEETLEQDGVKLVPMEIRIEQVDGQLLAYRLPDNKFLGQGRDREQLIESLTANLNNVRITIREDNGAKLILPQ